MSGNRASVFGLGFFPLVIFSSNPCRSQGAIGQSNSSGLRGLPKGSGPSVPAQGEAYFASYQGGKGACQEITSSTAKINRYERYIQRWGYRTAGGAAEYEAPPGTHPEINTDEGGQDQEQVSRQSRARSPD